MKAHALIVVEFSLCLEMNLARLIELAA